MIKIDLLRKLPNLSRWLNGNQLFFFFSCWFCMLLSIERQSMMILHHYQKMDSLILKLDFLYTWVFWEIGGWTHYVVQLPAKLPHLLCEYWKKMTGRVALLYCCLSAVQFQFQIFFFWKINRLELTLNMCLTCYNCMLLISGYHVSSSWHLSQASWKHSIFW